MIRQTHCLSKLDDVCRMYNHESEKRKQQISDREEEIERHKKTIQDAFKTIDAYAEDAQHNLAAQDEWNTSFLDNKMLMPAVRKKHQVRQLWHYTHGRYSPETRTANLPMAKAKLEKFLARPFKRMWEAAEKGAIVTWT